MRSPLPLFIFVGLALVAVIGIAVFSSASTAAVAEVNNSSREELPLTIYGAEYGLMFGIASLLMLVAAYFGLRAIIK